MAAKGGGGGSKGGGGGGGSKGGGGGGAPSGGGGGGARSGGGSPPSAPRPSPPPAPAASTARATTPTAPRTGPSSSAPKPMPAGGVPKASSSGTPKSGGNTQQSSIQKAQTFLAGLGSTISPKEKDKLIQKFGSQGKDLLKQGIQGGTISLKGKDKGKDGKSKDGGKTQITKTPAGTFVDLGDIESVFGSIMDVLGSSQAETFNELEGQYRLDEQMLENKSNERLGEFNLQGTQAQAEATKYASEQSAGATRFAATESARGQIETQKIASDSAERQIGLTGTEQRKTQADLLAGQERQIGLTGAEERLTVGKQAQEQRETELQQELYRRYREEKDYSQARSAFRA